MPCITSRFRKDIVRNKKSKREPRIRRILRENIKGKRLLCGFTQKQLGMAIGVSQAWINQMEDPRDKDFAIPDPYLIDALAGELGCVAADLFVPGKFKEGLSIELPRGRPKAS